MEFQLKFKVNHSLYLKDPEESTIGKAIISEAINLIFDIGFEQFNFKKLSQEIKTTEATVYRYFASKQKLLLYIMSWYWQYLEFQTKMSVLNKNNAKEKLELILEVITHNFSSDDSLLNIDLDKLNSIVISESSKVYLVKEVDEINSEMAYHPLKNYCLYISQIIKEFRPDYEFPNSLASTILETSHDQQFFSEHLNKLTDNFEKKDHKLYVLKYLNHLLFDVLKNN
ncbi:TetR/AcrR family transcriptional regulator [Halpernia frigidisoli]|uniref:Transcriptional regulator, TetR family n=1 Tax=Halpernia frigidisoli TaxID=1125876 RepID=A0A1I3HN79_9FLAO|nr:TetR/AcrR family transcriptional regulator [Halpernia frigidisoli]SFI37112.1 transcriptional regulator, TetR family [Halpernia frigidisoli]